MRVIRLDNLQEALVQIQNQVGILTDLSSLYETQAWGFEGPDFLNACIGIQTDFTPHRATGKVIKDRTANGKANIH